jgi:hypothetical protein
MKILLYLWQLPQHLLALLVIALVRATETFQPQSKIAYWFYRSKNKFSEFISGVSLGNYIILKTKNENVVRHEYGHSKQSLMLGWLYLPIIGIYSAVFCNLWDRLFHKSWSGYDRHYWYYMTRWTEKRADKLGGVDRAAVLRAMQKPQDARYPAA